MKPTDIIIGVVGNGFVGQATSLFASKHVSLLVYDIDPTKCNPKNLSMSELVTDCDIIFICVPTPMKENGECDTSIVENCIREIQDISKKLNPENDTNEKFIKHIVVRSTVPVGFCAKWGVNHMPEFLTEARWKNDFKETEQWIVGVADHLNYRDFESKITMLLQYAQQYGQILSAKKTFMDTDSTEFVKYVRNCYLAVKLSLCNEFYDFCKVKGIDYDNAMNVAASDKRIGQHYINVPGPDGKKGWGGVCLPKDTKSFANQQRAIGLNPLVLESAIERNTLYDRKEQDWLCLKNKGRTFI